MTTKLTAAYLFISILNMAVIAQELPLIPDKQGTFEILNRADYVGTGCSFTKTEMTAKLQITFRMITYKKFLEQRAKEYLQKNSISYHSARFGESLDMEFVNSLLPLIIK
jgi:hypothetical protein